MSRRRMLFKIGLTVVVGVGIILFYTVNFQDVDKVTIYRQIHHIHDDHSVSDHQDDGVHASEKLSADISDSKLRSTSAKGTDNYSQPAHGAHYHENGILVEDYLPGREKVSSASLPGPHKGLHMNHRVPRKDEGKKTDSHFEEKHLRPVIKSHPQPEGAAFHLCVVVCGNRQEETLTMLKSAVMVTPRDHILVFHIIAEPNHQQYFQQQLDFWPDVYRHSIAYNIYNVTFPEGPTSNDWRKLFKPCASQRLFLPTLLDLVDSLLYVDTDVLFLRSVADVWGHFSFFNSSQLVALVPEGEDMTTVWYPRFASHDFYGQFGVNSGVMLMNLTRLRQTTWLPDMQKLYQKYRLMIPWGDQDLINIYFAAHPDQLYIMPCEWNYRLDHCRYTSVCKTAEQHGVSVVHGSKRAFNMETEPVFGTLFASVKNFRLGDNLEYHFLRALEDSLNSAKPSNCGKVSQIFLMHLRRLVAEENTRLIKDRSELSGDNLQTNKNQGVEPQGQSDPRQYFPPGIHQDDKLLVMGRSDLNIKIQPPNMLKNTEIVIDMGKHAIEQTKVKIPNDASQNMDHEEKLHENDLPVKQEKSKLEKMQKYSLIRSDTELKNDYSLYDDEDSG